MARERGLPGFLAEVLDDGDGVDEGILGEVVDSLRGRRDPLPEDPAPVPTAVRSEPAEETGPPLEGGGLIDPFAEEGSEPVAGAPVDEGAADTVTDPAPEPPAAGPAPRPRTAPKPPIDTDELASGDAPVEVIPAAPNPDAVVGPTFPPIPAPENDDQFSTGIGRTSTRRATVDDFAEALASDLDGDGIIDRQDSDVDGDGVEAGFGEFDDRDDDNDGIIDIADSDADDDGFTDESEDFSVSDSRFREFATPFDVKQGHTAPKDFDFDGIADDSDLDLDNDSIPNRTDDDSDGDGTPNAEDSDQDNDGFRDDSERAAIQSLIRAQEFERQQEQQREAEAFIDDVGEAISGAVDTVSDFVTDLFTAEPDPAPAPDEEF